MEFQFGDWLVSPEANIVSNGEAKTQLEPRVMAVLRYLCRHPGAVIPAEEILQACWGSNELGDNPVHKAITQLRRAFGDSTTEPRYIETIRKRGYRAIAPIVTFAANGRQTPLTQVPWTIDTPDMPNSGARAAGSGNSALPGTDWAQLDMQDSDGSWRLSALESLLQQVA